MTSREGTGGISSTGAGALGAGKGERTSISKQIHTWGTGDSQNWHWRGGNRGQKGRRLSHAGNATKPPTIYTSDFQSLRKQSGALRYKVHEPGCSCSKIVAVRSTLLSTSSAETSDASMIEMLDGLVVVPDSKNIQFVYLCLGTGCEEFFKDTLSAERKLREELFGAEMSEKKGSQNNSSVKVSLAQCLLEDRPNGFICVSSPSRSTVDFARDMARGRAGEKRGSKGLHHDHAHFICTFPRRLLWKLYDKTLDEEQKALAKSDLLQNLSHNGVVPIDSLFESNTSVEVGYHLKSLLWISINDVDADATHWLTLVYDDTYRKKNPCWTIDLPGGKRHLGETTFEGAIRETEEEMSLAVNEQWLVGDGQPRSRRHKRRCRRKPDPNNYYVVTPPAELLMESLTKSDFCNNPGFCKEPPLSPGDKP